MNICFICQQPFSFLLDILYDYGGEKLCRFCKDDLDRTIERAILKRFKKKMPKWKERP